MRQPFLSSALRVSRAILAATSGLTGCGGEGSNPKDVSTVIPDESGMLRKVRSASELEGLLKDGLHEAGPSVTSFLSSGVAMPPSVDASAYSGTYTAEAGEQQLYGVRFVGERAYVVTFQMIDPLYVIDLSDAADPRLAGQLEIPGFSDFLHPVTENLLLGLGAANRQVKAELFDVSSLEHPQSRGTVLLGGEWSTSDAISDRHAFAWLPDAMTDRFAIPASIATGTGAATSVETSLFQFEIGGKQDAAGAWLSQAGRVTPEAGESFFYVNRSFIDGDTVWYVRDGTVWSSEWATPEQVHGPF